MDGVNNLNGIPNFGHGFDEEAPLEEVTETVPEVEEEVEITNQE